jgi:two-component system sensor histidine kinase KdpD
VDEAGPGLPPGEPARSFEKFHRTGEGTIVGVGLGLAICRAIVRAQGADIEARSQRGLGARFEFTLPTIEPEREMSGVGEQAA